MTTEERNEEQSKNELSTIRKANEVLAELQRRIAPRFRRAEVRIGICCLSRVPARVVEMPR